MLSTVEIRNVNGDVLSLPLEDITNGLAIENIDGLDPVKATIVSSKFAGMDGAQYHSSSREARNLVIKIGMYPNYTSSSVEELRNYLYSFLMPKSSVNLRFYSSSGLVVNTSGVVESLEAPLFTRDPQADLSVICFDPDFLELTDVTLSGSTVADSTMTTVAYSGTVETGITLVLNVNRTVSQFTIYHQPPDGSLRTLDFTAPLVTGDVVTLSTVTGAKGATLVRSGTSSSLLYSISPQSNWIELKKGNNDIRVYATGAAIPYTITYTPRHGGL